MPEKSDTELLREYADQGNEAAFREIVHRYAGLVYASALRQVRSAELARDIAQNVFSDLARKTRSLAGTLTGNASLLGWLYRSTRFEAHTQLRDDRRRQSRERQAMQELDTTSETEWERIGPVLDEAMADLSDEDREAVLLRYFKNLDFRAIGVTLGVSDDAAQKRVSRALERLRAGLASRGVTTTAVALGSAISANVVSGVPAGLAVALSTAVLSGTTLTTTATATQAIAMTTLQKTVITVALAAAVLVGIYEARQASTLRTQVQTLRQQQAEQIQQLQRDRDEAMAKQAQLQDESTRLNRNNSELLRLRGEVTRLRELEQQLAQLKKAAQAASEPNKPKMVAFGTEPQDMGATTPERAVSSLIWAAREGQQARVSELLELPEGVTEQEAPKHYEFFTRSLSNSFSSKEFVSLQDIKPNSDGTLRLRFAYRNVPTGTTNPFPFKLRRHDSAWKVVVEGEAPKELPSLNE